MARQTCLAKAPSSGLIRLTIVVPSRGISWHLLALATDFSSFPFPSLLSSSLLCSLLCATAQLLVQLENPLHLRLSLRILFSARKLIQIVALCNSFPPPLPLLVYTVIIIIITICTKSFRQLPISLSRFVPAQQWPARAF